MDEQDLRQAKLYREAMQGGDGTVSDDHPELDRLLSFHLGELDAPRTATIEAHVASCAPCRAVVADFVAFPDLEAAEGEVAASQHDVDALWRSVESALPEPALDSPASAGRDNSESQVIPAPPTVLGRPRPGFWSSLASLRLAASILLVSTLTLGGLLWQGPADSTVPALTAYEWLSLSPIDGDPSRASASATRLDAGSATGPLALSFEVSSAVDFERFSVEVRSDDGELLGRFDDLSRLRGVLGVLMPRQMLQPERTVIDLYGVDTEGRQPVATFVIELE